MAREVVIHVWCDFCQDLDDLQIDAKEMPPVQVGTTKARVLALCEEHEKTFFIPFTEALTKLGMTTDVLNRNERPKVGRPPNAQPVGETIIPATQAEAIVCPVLGCPSKPLGNTSSLRSHIRTKHQTTLDDVLSEGATLYDPSGHPLDYHGRGSKEPGTPVPPVQRAECDQPGCDVVYTYPENGRPNQALGLHRRMKHGITASGEKVPVKASA